MKKNKIWRKITNKFKLNKLIIYVYLNSFYLFFIYYIRTKKFKKYKFLIIFDFFFYDKTKHKKKKNWVFFSICSKYICALLFSSNYKKEEVK